MEFVELLRKRVKPGRSPIGSATVSKLWQQSIQQSEQAPLPNPARAVRFGRKEPELVWVGLGFAEADFP